MNFIYLGVWSPVTQQWLVSGTGQDKLQRAWWCCCSSCRSSAQTNQPEAPCGTDFHKEVGKCNNYSSISVILVLSESVMSLTFIDFLQTLFPSKDNNIFYLLKKCLVKIIWVNCSLMQIDMFEIVPSVAVRKELTSLFLWFSFKQNWTLVRCWVD